ncbi:MAG: tetratricopeptide repeat protein [Candidatus Delongbacteria bacterium]|nr:tetratricopeptide repeat protein [Candidatus Delongbacteria bacterium]MBN2837063.1 tetratricopeptide repeat protein [Candidatus Delongbacteria bacterium]
MKFDITTFKPNSTGLFRIKKNDYLCENCRSILEGNDYDKCPHCDAKSVPEKAYLSFRHAVESSFEADRLRHISDAIDEYPDFVEAYFIRGSIYFKMSKYTEALNDLTKSYEIYSDNYEELKKLAFIYAKCAKPEEAEKIYLKVLNIKEDDLETLLYLALLYGNSNDRLNQIKYYKKILEMDPDHLMALKELGKLYLEVEMFDECINITTKALKIQKDVTALTNRGIAYKKTAQEGKAIQDYYQSLNIINALIESSKDTPENLYARAYLNSKFDNDIEALKDLELLVKHYPTRPKYSQFLINTLLNLKKYDNAVIVIDNYINVFGEDKEMFLAKAKILFETKKYDESWASLNSYTTEEIEPIEALIMKGKICIYREEFEEARTFFDKALSQKPNDKAIYYNLLEVSEKSGNIPHQIRYLNILLNFDNSDSELLKKSSYAYFRQGDINESYNYLKKYLKTNPFDKDVFTLQFDILYRKGDLIDLDSLMKEHKDLLDNGNILHFIFLALKNRNEELFEDWFKTLKIIQLSSNEIIDLIDILISNKKEANVKKILEEADNNLFDKRLLEISFNFYYENDFEKADFYGEKLYEMKFENELFQKRFLQLLNSKGDYKRIVSFSNTLLEKKEEGEIFYLRGLAYYMLNKKLKSVKDLERAEELGFCNDSLLETKAKAYFDLEKFDKSISLFLRISDYNEEHINFIIDVYHKTKNFQSGFDFTLKILKKSISMFVLYHNALFAYNLNNQNACMEAISLYVQNFGESAEIETLKADVLMQSGKFKEASEIYFILKVKNEESEDLAFKLYNSYYKLNLNENLEDLLKKASKQFSNSQNIKKLMIMNLIKLSKFDEATELFEHEHLKIDKDLLNSIMTAYEKSKKIDKALDLLNSLDNFEFSGDINYYRGKIYETTGDFEKALKEYNHAIESQINNFEFYFTRGNVNLILNYFKDALSDFLDSRRLGCNHDRLNFLIGFCYEKLKNFDESIKFYNKHLDNNSVDLQILSSRASCYMELNEFDKAISDLDIVLSSNENSIVDLLNRGNALLSLKKYEEAIKDFSKLINFGKGSKTIFLTRGLCYTNILEFKNAVDDFDKVLDTDPSNCEALLNRGLAHLNTGNLQKGIIDLENYLKSNDDTKVKLQLANAFYENKEFDKAKIYYEELLESYNNNFSIHQNLAECLSIEKNFSESIKHLDKAIQIGEKSKIDKEILSNLILQKAIVYLNSGNDKKAFEEFKKAENLTEDKSNVYVSRGVHYFKIEDYNNAISDFNHVLESDPNNIDVLEKLFISEKKLDHTENALDLCDKILKIDNNKAEFTLHKANLYFSKKDYSNASLSYSDYHSKIEGTSESYLNSSISYFENGEYNKSLEEIGKAINLDKNCSNLYLARTKIYNKLNDFDNMLKDYRTALDLDPENSIALKNYGNILFYSGNLIEASIVFKKLVKIDPANSEYHYRKADIEFNQKNNIAAKASIGKAIERNNIKHEYYKLHSEILFRLGELDNAIDQINNAINLDGNISDYYRIRAELLLKKNDLKKAMLDIDKAIVLNDSNAEFYHLRSKINANQNNKEESISDLTKAYEISNDVVYLKLRGEKYFTTKQYQKAIDDYEKANSDILDGGDLKRMAVSYYKVGELNKSISALTKLLNLVGDDIEALIKRANTFMKTGDYSGAIEDYSRILKLEPKLVLVYSSRAIAYQKAGLHNESEADFGKYLEMTYNMPFSRK